MERLKWFLWHGNVFRALQVVADLELDLDVEHAPLEQRKLLKAVTEFGGYIRTNASGIPNLRGALSVWRGDLQRVRRIRR